MLAGPSHRVPENSLLADTYRLTRTVLWPPTQPLILLGTTLAGITDVISLQATKLGGGGSDQFAGSLNWRELY